VPTVIALGVLIYGSISIFGSASNEYPYQHPRRSFSRCLLCYFTPTVSVPTPFVNAPHSFFALLVFALPAAKLSQNCMACPH